MTSRRPAFALLLAITVPLLTSVAPAGPLNPPAGAIASTAKPLAEIEPRTAINAVNTPGDADSVFRITQPGSYYLTGNLAGVAGKCGIEITVSGVTVDLCGFELAGVTGSLSGVRTAPDQFASLYNITVRNGTFRNWGGYAVSLGSTWNTRVEGISAQSNGGGIAVQHHSVITNCTCITSGGDGIQGAEGVNVSDCVVWSCIFGIRVDVGSVVTRCTVKYNSSSGISASSSTITHCAATRNTGHGISGFGSTITGCVATSNSADGISAGGGANITACTANSNGSDGIQASGSSTIAGCTVNGNSAHGINVTGGPCVVRDNTCSANGPESAGISVSAISPVLGTGTRIEGNTCSGSYYGILVTNSGNIILRNSCRATTYPWQIAAGNSMGSIVNATTNAAAIEGVFAPSAPSTLSTDPNANYTY
jgi:parallel beta-helix repeat protein